MTKICSIPSCGRPVHCGGLCGPHEYRLRKHGDPLGGRDIYGTQKIWVAEHVGHVGDECLSWPFTHSPNGYAYFRLNGHWDTVHREMCRLKNGEPPTERHDAAHTCGRGNKGCVNPNHLVWKTPEENMADKNVHGTDNRGEKHPLHKLTSAAVLHIRRNPNKYTPTQWGKMFGVRPETIGKIQRNERRKHIQVNEAAA